jgi:hypothetical protein
MRALLVVGRDANKTYSKRAPFYNALIVQVDYFRACHSGKNLGVDDEIERDALYA